MRFSFYKSRNGSPSFFPEKKCIRRSGKAAFLFTLLMTISPALHAMQNDGERWQLYMHGMQDTQAQALRIEALFPTLKTSPAELPSLSKKSIQKLAITLYSGQKITSQTLPVDLKILKDSKIRIFIWAKSTEDKAERSFQNSYGVTPNIMVIQKDANDQQISKSASIRIATLAPFPWHCYYIEAFVSSATEKLYIELQSGKQKVSFSTPSWEKVTPDNTPSLNEKQDPVTGSLASNVYHDEMNRQFMHGIATRHPWRYFMGPGIGMKGQRYDITTPSGLEKYFNEKVLLDNDHMNHSLMYFASRYHKGKKANLLPDNMNEDWLLKLTQLVMAAQNADTGYWGTIHTPNSMGITFHIIEGLFSYYPLMRSDMASRPNNERHLSELTIPNATIIVRTTLKMQSNNPSSGNYKAGWASHSYNFTRFPNISRNRASLVTTSNAIEILRRCRRFVSDAEKVEIDQAIRDATLYVLEKMVLPDGAWLQSDTDKEPKNHSFLGRLLNNSTILEQKISTAVSKPAIKIANSSNGKLTVRRIGKHSLSVRIYAASADTEVKDINERHLVAVIPGRNKNSLSDPILTIKRIDNASRLRWGVPLFKKSSYSDMKLNRVDFKTLSIAQKETLSLTIKSDAKFYASSITDYGEESPRLPIYPAL
jgi:hypothetical protein